MDSASSQALGLRDEPVALFIHGRYLEHSREVAGRAFWVR